MAGTMLVCIPAPDPGKDTGPWNLIPFSIRIVGLKALPDKAVDLILTDPPYGKKADKGTNGFGAAKNRRYTGGWDGMIPPP